MEQRIDTVIVVSAAVQALAALTIVFLTAKLVSATNKYVNETQRIVRENQVIASFTAERAFLETLPILACSQIVFDRFSGSGGTWKNVGRGPAINVRLAVQFGAAGGGGSYPNQMGQSNIEHIRGASLAPGETLAFVNPNNQQPIFLARYDDLYGNRYVSVQSGYEYRPLIVARVAEEAGGAATAEDLWREWDWEMGTPISDIIARVSQRQGNV
jgi:hypothetical protein